MAYKCTCTCICTCTVYDCGDIQYVYSLVSFMHLYDRESYAIHDICTYVCTCVYTCTCMYVYLCLGEYNVKVSRSLVSSDSHYKVHLESNLHEFLCMYMYSVCMYIYVHVCVYVFSVHVCMWVGAAWCSGCGLGLPT
jgi:hypothetical protein